MTESNVPATQQDMQWANTGLEDFSVTDAVLPRIKIEHADGLWSENLGNERFEILRFICLGLVKQRVLFHHKVEDNDVPMCKSADFETGYPNPDAPRDKSFPWELSGFDPKDFQPDTEGNIKLPCSGCALKDWGSNPVGDTPYCSEQWTLPIYYDLSLRDEWAPAILTLQKSSIKPIRTFLTAFAQSNKPPFLSIGRATLRVQQRGMVKYSIPTFTKEGESDRERWQEFSEQFKEMRSFLTRPPVRETDTPVASSDNTNTAPATQQDPWATTAQPTEPPAQSAPPVQQQPTQQTPPPTQQQPVQQQPAQQAPAAAPPPQQTPPPAGQELPF